MCQSKFKTKQLLYINNEKYKFSFKYDCPDSTAKATKEKTKTKGS